MSKIIAVANQKGGSGKTTVTNNLGKYYSKKGMKVLLIDFDPQGSLSYTMTAEMISKGGIVDIFSDFLFDEEPDFKSIEPFVINNNLHIYTSNQKLGAVVRADPFFNSNTA